MKFRFNWKTPFILSPHNSQIHYSAGNYVLRSLKKGDGVKRISPEITNTDRGAATAWAQSPSDANVVYVGTDDGALWVTRDGGTNWTDCFATVEEVVEEEVETEAPAKDSVIRGPSDAVLEFGARYGTRAVTSPARRSTPVE